MCICYHRRDLLQRNIMTQHIWHHASQLLSGIYDFCLLRAIGRCGWTRFKIAWLFSEVLSHIPGIIFIFDLILTCLVLSCLVLSCLVLSCLVLSCLVLSCLVLSCRFSYLLVSSRIFSSRIFSSRIFSYLLVSSLLIFVQARKRLLDLRLKKNRLTQRPRQGSKFLLHHHQVCAIAP